MRKALMALMFGGLVLPAAAGAQLGACQPAHCYSVKFSYASHYGSIAAINTLSAHTTETGASFITNESWEGFGCPSNCWIETGQMIRGESPAAPVHLFYAEETAAGEFFIKIDFNHDSERGRYVYTLAYDERRDGCWQIYWWWGPPPNGWKIRAAEYCGWPAAYAHLSAGAELFGISEPHDNGRIMVAATEYLHGPMLYEGEWLPWTQVTGPDIIGNMSQGPNPDSSAPGNIEWDTPGVPAGAPVQSTEPRPAAGTGKVVYSNAATGRTLKAKLGTGPAGATPPAGLYRAKVRTSTYEAEYVGPRLPTEAEVRAGGSR